MTDERGNAMSRVLDLQTAEGREQLLENIVSETLKAALPAERILLDPEVAKGSITARTLHSEFCRWFLDLSRGIPLADPLARSNRIGPLGAILMILINGEAGARKDEFLDAIREVRAKQQERRRANARQTEDVKA